MGHKARQTAMKKFDIKNIAKQYETLLIETVHKK